MHIELKSHFDKALLDEANRLLPQLSGSAKPMTEVELRAILDSDTSHLLIAEDAGHLCGMLTLAIFRIPTGVRAWIEDVVVDEAQRGQGVGKLLVNAAIDLARSQGAATIDLTSRPSREAANRLYRKLGFEPRDTNIYRIKL